MACNSEKISTKKKVIKFSSVSLTIATATYLIFVTTNNSAIAAALPALLSIAACPLMCAAVGGLMWFSHHSCRNNDSNKGNSHNMLVTINAIEVPCCSQEILKRTNKNQNEDLEVTRITELPNSNNNKINDVGSLIQQKARK